MTKLNPYERCATEGLSPYPGNPRVHSTKQIYQIANSIERFGYIAPIIGDEQYQILAGHGCLLAAKQLGLPRVPVVRIDHLSEEEKRAYRLAGVYSDGSLHYIFMDYLDKTDLIK